MKENQEFIKLYLSLRANAVTKRSLKAFEWDLQVFCKFLGSVSIKDVTHKDIDRFLSYCRIERKNGDEALARKYNTLNTFYKILIFKEYLDIKNPFDKVDKLKVRKKLRSHVTLGEYKQIINYLKSINKKRELTLFSLLFSSGIRLSEAFEIKCSDLDLENRQFVVKGKGEKERACIFSKECKEYILDYAKNRINTDEALFLTINNTKLSKARIQHIIKESAKQAKVSKNIHTHLLRHGTAMFLLENGLPLDEIQKVLGHESISTTQIYAKTSMNRVKKNVDNIFNNI